MTRMQVCTSGMNYVKVIQAQLLRNISGNLELTNVCSYVLGVMGNKHNDTRMSYFSAQQRQSVISNIINAM